MNANEFSSYLKVSLLAMLVGALAGWGLGALVGMIIDGFVAAWILSVVGMFVGVLTMHYVVAFVFGICQGIRELRRSAWFPLLTGAGMAIWFAVDNGFDVEMSRWESMGFIAAGFVFGLMLGLTAQILWRPLLELWLARAAARNERREHEG